MTYIEDFGRALVTLGESDEAFWEVWHVPNAETITKPVVLAEILEGDDPCWAEVVVWWGSGRLITELEASGLRGRDRYPVAEVVSRRDAPR